MMYVKARQEQGVHAPDPGWPDCDITASSSDFDTQILAKPYGMDALA